MHSTNVLASRSSPMSRPDTPDLFESCSCSSPSRISLAAPYLPTRTLIVGIGLRVFRVRFTELKAWRVTVCFDPAAERVSW
jgi:hypothetical protein